jgi:hypothetical protein
MNEKITDNGKINKRYTYTIEFSKNCEKEGDNFIIYNNGIKQLISENNRLTVSNRITMDYLINKYSVKKGTIKIKKVLNNLQIWEDINQCKTLEEVSYIILDISNEGRIQGRNRTFNSNTMAKYCLKFNEHKQKNLLTRNYGIRQQVIYLAKN